MAVIWATGHEDLNLGDTGEDESSHLLSGWFGRIKRN